MPIEIRVPRLGWSMEEGGFVGWLKKDGEPVKAGEPLFTLEGDKATQEIEASDDGILRIDPGGPKPGSPVVVGALLGFLQGKDEAWPSQAAANPSLAPGVEAGAESIRTPSLAAARPATAQQPPPPAAPHAHPPQRSSSSGNEDTSKRVAISPRALRMAAEFGVDWRGLKGTGRSGRIRSSDVLAVASAKTPAASMASAGAKRILAPAQVPSGTIVITDWTFSDLEVEQAILRPLGVQVISRQCRTEEDLVALVADADAVITQFARLNAKVISAMARARVIVRYGIGVDNIDLEAARAAGIPVCNVPDYCIDEVADQTLAFLLALTRQVLPHAEHVRAGRWGLATPIENFQALAALTVGIVGFGRIGRAVARRLAAFGCRLLVHDPVVAGSDIESAGATPVGSLAELLPACDVLTLHCPSTAQTRHMLDAAAFLRMKPGALLINVARGDLIDTTALVGALQSGPLAAAALDVCDPEPIPVGHPLLQLKNVVLAPHIASVSPKAVRTLRETVASLAAIGLTGVVPPNVVNGVQVTRSV